MERTILTTVVIWATWEQREALRRLEERAGLGWPAVIARINQAAHDGADREIARLTTAGPESSQGWQQRCNACRAARAEECAACANLGDVQAGATAGDGARVAAAGGFSPVKPG